MNKFKREYLKRRMVAIFLMAMMVFGCAAPLNLGVYAVDEETQTYKVTFWDELEDVQIGETQVVEEGGTAVCPEAPDHYPYATFTGWDPDGAWIDVHEDITIYATYSENTTYTITFKDNVDGHTIKEEVVEEGQSATAPTASHSGYTFINWDKEQSAWTDVHADATITAVFKKNPDPPTITATAKYESVTASWPKVKNEDGEEVRYQIKWMAYGSTSIIRQTTTIYNTFNIPFDPYPGDANGQGQNANAKKLTIAMRSYYWTKDPLTGADKVVYGNWVWKSGVEVIHPMYVIVKTKRKANIYGSQGSYKSIGTAPEGKYYVVIGGSRVDGENKRVIFKVGKNLRYLKSSDVRIMKMVYNSKTYYSKAQVENFVNTANGGKPIVSNPKTKTYPKRMIWVNTYNQRVYLFNWNATTSKWYIFPYYGIGTLCNTGKELTPYGEFKISNKWAVKESTGTRWWCIFNSVGIHEQLGEALGKPASGGCIRVRDDVAKRFYKELVKVGYTVLVY